MASVMAHRYLLPIQCVGYDNLWIGCDELLVLDLANNRRKLVRIYRLVYESFRQRRLQGTNLIRFITDQVSK